MTRDALCSESGNKEIAETTAMPVAWFGLASIIPVAITIDTLIVQYLLRIGSYMLFHSPRDRLVSSYLRNNCKEFSYIYADVLIHSNS
jgi:hypothetical protein